MIPFIIGVAGGTGSGKTTLTRNIIETLRRMPISVVRADWYYRDQDDIPLDERRGANYDHPDALEHSLLIQHLKDLRRGQQVMTPRYNFHTHTRLPNQEALEPTPVVIVEGILLFAVPELRDQFDLKIFVQTDSDLRLLRRLKRDTAERGRSLENSLQQYLDTVRPMHLTFVEPSKLHADIIIPASHPNEKAINMVVDMIHRRADRQKRKKSKISQK